MDVIDLGSNSFYLPIPAEAAPTPPYDRIWEPCLPYPVEAAPTPPYDLAWEPGLPYPAEAAPTPLYYPLVDIYKPHSS